MAQKTFAQELAEAERRRSLLNSGGGTPQIPAPKATQTPTIIQRGASNPNYTENRNRRWQESGSAQNQAPATEKERNGWDTAWDTINMGAGMANKAGYGVLDFAANLLPRAESAVFGVEPEATFTGQLLKPVTDATGKLMGYIDRETAAAQERAYEDTKDSKAARLAVDLGAGTVAAAPNAVLAWLSGGASLATSAPTLATGAGQASGILGTAKTAVTQMLNNPMYKVSVAQGLNSAYEQAVADGATESEALLAAALSSGFNAMVEVGGGVETLPGQLNGADLSTGRKALEWAKSALDEGKEEMVQSVLDGFIRKGVYDHDRTVFSAKDENAIVHPRTLLKEGAMGTAIGGILGGGQVLGTSLMDAVMADVMKQSQQNQPTTENPADKLMQDVMAQNKTAPVVETGTESITTQNRPLTEDDLDAYMRTGKTGHTRDRKQAMLLSGESPILRGAQQIKSFISDAIHGKRQGQTKAYGVVGTDFANAVKTVSPDLDITGYYLELTADALDHAYKEHSKAKEYGDIDLSESDFENIPEYINNFDHILSVENYNGKKKIRIGKKINGYSVILETVSGERKSLHVLNMIGMSTKKYEKKYATKISTAGSPRGQTPQTVNTTSWHTEHGTDSDTAVTAVSNPHIPQPEQSVNSENVGDMGVNPAMTNREKLDAAMADVMEQARRQKNQTTPQQDMVDAMVRDAMGAKASDSGETATARVLTEEPPTGKKKISAWNLFKDNVVDKGTVFETLSLKTGNRELQAKWKAIGRAESSAQWFMEHGNAETNSLKSIRETVEKSGKTQAFYDYLYHLHNVDRMNLEARYDGAKNKPVFGDSVTSELSAEEAAKLEQENPEFKQWANEVYSYISALRNMMVEGGIISQKTADLWAEMYPHYVPIRRKGKEGLGIDVPLDTKRTGINAPTKRAKGGNADILPLFNTMAARTEQTFKAIAKNRFGVELKNLLGSDINKQTVSLDEAIDSAESETLEEGKDGKNPTFTVFENGKKVTFEITDEMYNTMKPKSDAMSYTSKALNNAGNARRGLLTEYNPAFMITNPIKDFQDVLVNSQHPARTYAKIPKAISELRNKKGQYYREYMEHGGEQNTYFDGKTKNFSKEKSRLSKVIGFPLEKISQANNFIERIPRMAEYIASREMGRSIDESMLDAARVTTDFSAGGDLTKMLNRNGFTFLNASVQGAVQQVRNFREAKYEGAKGWAKLAAKILVAGLPQMLLNDLIWGDDEDYEELSEYVKQNYYCIAKYGDGKFVRIPKGRAVAVIQDAFKQMKNLITGDDEADLDAFAELAVSNLAPNNPLENHLLAPVSQAMKNKAWHGGDIVPTRLQDLPAAEQYDESTDEISKWLGEKLDVSPYKVNYVLDQYSGAIGDVVLPMLTPEAERGNNRWWGNVAAPIADKFTTDSVMNNQNVSDFYSKKEELTTKANSSKATKEDEVRSKYMDNVNAELAKLYKEQREIQNGDLPNDEKYEAVRDVQKKIVALTKEALNAYGSIRMEKDYRPDGATKDLIVKAMDSVGGYGDKTSEQNYRNLIYSPATAVIGGDVQDKVFEYAVRYNDAVTKEAMGYPITTGWMVEAKNIKSDRDRVDYFIGYVTGEMAKEAGDGKYDGLGNLLDEGTIDDRAALLACSDTVEDAYLAHCKSAGVPVGTWLEVYGYANAQDGSKGDQREKGLKYIELLPASPKKKVALAKALYAAIKGFIPYEAKIPKDWLARVGG